MEEEFEVDFLKESKQTRVVAVVLGWLAATPVMSFNIF